MVFPCVVQAWYPSLKENIIHETTCRIEHDLVHMIEDNLQKTNHVLWLIGHSITNDVAIGIVPFWPTPRNIYEDQSDTRFLGFCRHYDTITWRHHMETFSALLALSVGNPSVTGGFPSQRPLTRSFDVFLDLRVNKRLSQ